MTPPSPADPTGTGPAPGPVTLGCGVEVDVARGEVRSAGVRVHLTPTELALMLDLAIHAGRTRTRAQLLNDVWGYPDDSGARTVDSHVRALRRKLGDDAIRTVHGLGYELGD